MVLFYQIPCQKMKNHYYNDLNDCNECGVHFKSFDLERHIGSVLLDDNFQVYI